MNDRKWFHTMEVFDEYERRFAQARCNKKLRQVCEPSVRTEIVDEAKKYCVIKMTLFP